MTALDQALIEETAKKSALLWVRGPQGPARALWHVWHEGAVCLVGRGSDTPGPDADPGRTEQPLVGLGLTDGGTATVTARSKDKGGRLVAWPARVVELRPGTEAWQAATEELKGKRLNAPDSGTLLERWSRDCRVLRLEPAGAPVQAPDRMPDTPQAAPPLPSPATTRRPAPAGLPKLLLRGRRGKRR
ncbi:hypothetical protein RM572_04360 [Streptomyces sp. DSM 42041]|uniref:Uncharacterized protein n=1 Tax=Streptomyces hazeniae TaxID=3075538 RepID=A0ABU2NP63_9ACTN|nr:hypothetical protein [Streptomyces sp. DSM 42041]MDT0378008.1 hypothetical protein [Streptomyces sp. DSM 42041]